MSELLNSVSEHVAGLDMWAALVEAALLAAIIGSIFLYVAHQRHKREQAARDKAWRSRSGLRSRGA